MFRFCTADFPLRSTALSILSRGAGALPLETTDRLSAEYVHRIGRFTRFVHKHCGIPCSICRVSVITVQSGFTDTDSNWYILMQFLGPAYFAITNETRDTLTIYAGKPVEDNVVRHISGDVGAVTFWGTCV